MYRLSSSSASVPITCTCKISTTKSFSPRQILKSPSGNFCSFTGFLQQINLNNWTSGLGWEWNHCLILWLGILLLPLMLFSLEEQCYQELMAFKVLVDLSEVKESQSGINSQMTFLSSPTTSNWLLARHFSCATTTSNSGSCPQIK